MDTDELRRALEQADDRVGLCLAAEAEAANSFRLSGEGFEEWRKANRASKAAMEQLDALLVEYLQVRVNPAQVATASKSNSL
jgi:hypothetical protein